jgi:hypothetical protein
MQTQRHLNPVQRPVRPKQQLGTDTMTFPDKKIQQAPSARKNDGTIQVEDVIPVPSRSHAPQPQAVGPQSHVDVPNVEKDSRYVTVTLPSNFYFYPFKTLAVKNFLAAEQAKCVRAANEGRIRHLVDAISATIQPGISAYSLTQQDFRFLMYWHRLNSFGAKTPFVHSAVCEDSAHIQDVIDGKLKDETLKIKTILTSSMLKETQYNHETMNYAPPELANFKLGQVIMKDLVDLSEMEDDATYPDIEWIADFACHLDPSVHGDLRQRIQIASQMTPEEIEHMHIYMDSVSAYGITETVNIRCKECGAERVAEVTIDALSFLPSPRRAISSG